MLACQLRLLGPNAREYGRSSCAFSFAEWVTLGGT